VSYIPAESEPLRALAQINRHLVQAIGRRCADQKMATIDLDATVIESWKRVALKDKWLRARPKRLRFHFFYSPGKLIHHARSVMAKVQRKAAELAE
jgi:hypothetical protein